MVCAVMGLSVADIDRHSLWTHINEFWEWVINIDYRKA